MRIKKLQQLIDFLRNKKAGENEFFQAEISLSNNCKYPQFCLNAALSDKIFKNFKTSPIYREILEHVDLKFATEYIKEIKKYNPELLKGELIEKFKKNDKYGNPKLFEFDDLGKISGTTLRYINILSLIISMFDSLEGKNVCEIGVGYGGQMRIISEYFNLNSYTLVDMHQVLMLAQKFLDCYPIKTTINYKTMHELSYDTKYDFVISNYAFSEITREFQEIYIEKVLKNSKSGIMVMNQVAYETYNSYSKEELCQILPNNPRIIPEAPLTYENNYVIVWGEKNK